MDFTDIFSLVVKPITVRFVLTKAVSKGRVLRQLDISNAFLNGHENIYMVQPQGFVDKKFPDYVCKLKVLKWTEAGSACVVSKVE